MVKVINNNLWSPVPWGWGCHGCDGGNNWLNKMFGYQMMFGMMNNMTNMFANCFGQQKSQQPMPQTYLPFRQNYNPYGNFYPGLNLNSQNSQNTSYEDYMNKMQAQNDLTQLKQTWKEFTITNIGGKYQAILKADKTVNLQGGTVDELMTNIVGYVNENPDKFKAKEKPTDSSEGAGGVSGATSTQETNGTEAGTETDAAPSTEAPTAEKKRKVKDGWYQASTHKINYLRNNLTTEKVKNASNVAETLITAWNSTKFTGDKNSLIAEIKKQNPSVFEANGNVKNNADFSKLDVPGLYWANTHCKKKSNDLAPQANGNKAKVTYKRNEQIQTCNGTLQTDALVYNNKNMIYKNYNNGGANIDADLIMNINGYHYSIDGEDFYKALGMRDESWVSDLAGGNDNIIDPKTGKFKANGHWPSNGFILKCEKAGNTNGKNLSNSKLTVEKGKVVLIVGKNRFLMDDVMSGKIPSAEINGNANNKYKL